MTQHLPAVYYRDQWADSRHRTLSCDAFQFARTQFISRHRASPDLRRHRLIESFRDRFAADHGCFPWFGAGRP